MKASENEMNININADALRDAIRDFDISVRKLSHLYRQMNRDAENMSQSDGQLEIKVKGSPEDIEHLLNHIMKK